MAKHERFLVINVGSTAIHVGEFETVAGDIPLMLHGYDTEEYSESLTEQNRADVIHGAIETVLANNSFRSKKVYLCVSGQAAFMRFVKLPPITDDESSVRRIVRHEAKQNVPFPIEEVVWDYQLIAKGEDADELEVMFAVIKNEIVEAVIQAVRRSGLKPASVDFSPGALYNAAQFNYVGDDECAMFLDIGGKCTTLLFLEGSRFFARSIPIAGASITQQVAKEFNISHEEAEVLKRRYGFVSLGGAYEEPESEVAATISKLVRAVMTRLHGEINRTINIYRSQQKGSKPTRLILAGGSSTMAFTNHFFSEKLRMEVEYFNAFQIIRKPSHIDLEELSEKAHLLPELVGVALRRAYRCPVEIDLNTRDIESADQMHRRVPVVAASCGVLLLLLGIIWVVSQIQVDLLTTTLEAEKQKFGETHQDHETIRRHRSKVVARKRKYDELKKILTSRYRWDELFNELQAAKPVDVWLADISLLTKEPAEEESAAADDEGGRSSRGSLLGNIGDKKGGASVSTPGQVTWLQLTGYAVRIPETSEGDGEGKRLRPRFTEEQLKLFRQRMRSRATVDDEGDNGVDAAAGRLPEFVGNNRIPPDDTFFLEEIFLDSLAFSDYFGSNVDDKNEVRLASVGRTNQTVENIYKFTIHVKLAKPIVLTRDL